MFLRQHKYKINSKYDWTSWSDIGKKFDGKPLTVDIYKRTEDEYAVFLETILAILGIKELSIKDKWIDPDKNRYKNRMYDSDISRIEAINSVSQDDINLVVRSSLREVARFNLVGTNGVDCLRVKFGDDFYVSFDVPDALEERVFSIPLTETVIEKIDWNPWDVGWS